MECTEVNEGNGGLSNPSCLSSYQCMKKTPTMRKISDLSEVFIKRIEGMMVGYDEVRVVFDRYIDQSLKNQTCQKKAVMSTEYVKSEVPFTRLFTNETLEQEIKELKRHGGMVGLSQDEDALDRLVITTPHLAHIVKQFLNSFPQSTKLSEQSEMLM